MEAFELDQDKFFALALALITRGSTDLAKDIREAHAAIETAWNQLHAPEAAPTASSEIRSWHLRDKFALVGNRLRLEDRLSTPLSKEAVAVLGAFSERAGLFEDGTYLASRYGSGRNDPEWLPKLQSVIDEINSALNALGAPPKEVWRVLPDIRVGFEVQWDAGLLKKADA